MNSCIYKITNLVNNKIYIGQTINLRKRINSHSCLLREENRNDRSIIKQAFKKYGKSNFKIDIITQGNFNKELLNDLEIHYIQLYNSTNNKIGYNLTKGGQYSANSHLKETFVYNLDGEYITSYKSAAETARSLNLNSDTVNAVCRKEKERIKNYRFSYIKMDRLPPRINKRITPLKIKIVSTGEIKEYETHKECAKDLKCCKSIFAITKKKYKEGEKKNLIFKHGKYEIIL
jgi:hypothetical protein